MLMPHFIAINCNNNFLLQLIAVHVDFLCGKQTYIESSGSKHLCSLTIKMLPIRTAPFVDYRQRGTSHQALNVKEKNLNICRANLLSAHFKLASSFLNISQSCRVRHMLLFQPHFERLVLFYIKASIPPSAQIFCSKIAFPQPQIGLEFVVLLKWTFTTPRKSQPMSALSQHEIVPLWIVSVK